MILIKHYCSLILNIEGIIQNFSHLWSGDWMTINFDVMIKYCRLLLRQVYSLDQQKGKLWHLILIKMKRMVTMGMRKNTKV